MPSGIFYPASNADDGWCKPDSSSFNSSTSPIYIGNFGGAASYAFFRFLNVTIPQGAIITNAYIRITANASDSGTTVNLNCYFHNDTDVAADEINSGSKITGASLTSLIAWNGLSAWTNGLQYDSPDLKDIFQDIIDLSGWSSGNAVCLQLRNNGSTSGRRASGYEVSAGAEKAELHISWEDIGTSEDEFGVDDEIQSAGGSYEVSAPDQSGISDQIEAQGGSQNADGFEGFGISGEVNLIGEFQVYSPDQFGLNDFVNSFLATDSANGELGIDDNITGGLEFDLPVDAEGLGISDLTDALNWSEFLINNREKYLRKYFCTLTGSADGVEDVELPMQSFQARKRDGEDTFVSANIPGIGYFEQISNRPNGQIVIEMAFFVDGVEQLREEILRVNLENIRYDKGARSRAVTISGHRTESFAVNLVDLENPSYKYLSEGKLRYRFPIPDPWLNPGDTCSVQSEGDEFRVDYITYVVSPRYKFMEVSEA